MNASSICTFNVVVISIFLLGCLCFFELKAQSEFRFYPCKTHSAESKELIADLKSLITKEYESALQISRARDHHMVRQLYYQRTKYLIDLVKAKWFIKNDSLETYTSAIIKRLVDRHSLSTRPRKILIARSHEVNAICYGSGIYIIPVGLLARIENEGNLAFTLAHEMAHDELNHVQSNLLHQVRIKLEKKSQEQVKRILNGSIELEDIEEFQQLVYGISRHDRAKEMAADSLGFMIFNSARYNEQDAISMLSVLESAQEPKYDFGAEVFLPLDAEDFPLQTYFFKEQLSIYSRKHASNILMLSTDSISSHPDINMRKQLLQSYLTESSYNDRAYPNEFVKAVTALAEFETVESAYRSMDFDWCMFHALQLLQLYPGNSYLISRISSMLLRLHEIKNDNTIRVGYASRFTTYYSPMAKLVNNMLYNLTARDALDMAFYFLRTPGHFDISDESHYYLLWRISELSGRHDVRDETAHAYKTRFGRNINALDYP